MTLANQGGQISLNVDPQGTFTQREHVEKTVALEPPDRRRPPKKPVIQIRLPIFFVTDEA